MNHVIRLASLLVLVAGSAAAQQAVVSGDAAWKTHKIGAMPTLEAAQALDTGAKEAKEVFEGMPVIRREAPGLAILEEKNYEKEWREEGRWRNSGPHGDGEWIPARTVKVKGVRQKVGIIDKAAFVSDKKKKGAIWGGGIGVVAGLLLGLLTMNPFVGVAVAAMGLVIGTAVAEYKADKHEKVFERDVEKERVVVPDANSKPK